MKISKRWWVLFIISLAVIVPFMAPYLSFAPSNSRVPITSSTIQYPALVAHILFAFIALISGFFQFVDHLRIHNPHVHRYLGRIYVSSVFISGLLALVVIFYVEDFSKAVSFLVLSLIWLFTGWKGYRAAMKRRFDEHRRWMIRSFGMTLVAVSGRLIVPLLFLTYYTLNGFSLPGGIKEMIEEVLKANIWVALIINFIIVEWVILKRHWDK